MHEYMVEADCPEDFDPLKKRLRELGLQHADADQQWVTEARGENKSLDGMYLSVRTDLPRDDLESVIQGQGWSARIVVDREPPSYPA
jgi:hypothetical protein